MLLVSSRKALGKLVFRGFRVRGRIGSAGRNRFLTQLRLWGWGGGRKEKENARAAIILDLKNNRNAFFSGENHITNDMYHKIIIYMGARKKPIFLILQRRGEILWGVGTYPRVNPRYALLKF